MFTRPKTSPAATIPRFDVPNNTLTQQVSHVQTVPLETSISIERQQSNKSPIRRRSLSRSNLLVTSRSLDPSARVRISKSKFLSDHGSFSIQSCKSKQIQCKLVAKTIRWTDASMTALLEREASAATLLTHPRIAHFFGSMQHNDKQYLIYKRYDMTLEEAIRTCRKPSKEERIAMATHLVEAIAHIHSFNMSHTTLTLDHVLVRTTFPWIVRVPYVKEAFVSNLAYATESTRESTARDMRDLAYLIACVMYWNKIDPKQVGEWIRTFRSRHTDSIQFVKLLVNLEAYDSARDLFREWNVIHQMIQQKT